VNAALRPGDHVCWMYDDERDRLAAAAGFVLAGLADGHRTVYCATGEPAAAMPATLRAGGIDVPAALRTGRLILAAAADVYLTGGRFDPGECLARWSRGAEQARTDGYRGLRAVADMTWAADRPPGAGVLAGYELAVNGIVAEGFASGVCQYDVRRFTAPRLRTIQMAHPSSLRAGAPGDTVPLLRIRRLPGPRLQLDGECDLSNRTAVQVTVAAVCRDAAAVGQEAVIDVTGLRFADVATGRMLVRAAATVPGGITVTGCTKSLTRLLRMFGAREPNIRCRAGDR